MLYPDRLFRSAQASFAQGFTVGATRWLARSPRRLELVGGVGGLGIAAVGVGFLVSRRKG